MSGRPVAVLPRTQYERLSETPPKKSGGGCCGLRVLPPTAFEFDTLLFLELFHRLEKLKYTHKENGVVTVHVMLFRRFIRRLLDTVHLNHRYEVQQFGGEKGDVWLTWTTIRDAARAGAVPPIDLVPCERIALTLEDPGSCWLASFWTFVMVVAILGNVVLIVLQSMPEYCDTPRHKGGGGSSTERHCYQAMEDGCVLLFSAEYFLKLFCSPFCRHAIFERQWHLEVTVPEPKGVAGTSVGLRMSRLDRLVHFIVRPTNLVDLAAIAPFWLTLLGGDIFPIPLSFLRSLRLMRFFRVMKLGRFTKTLAVLGTTLASSTQAVYVLMIWVVICSLILGAMLQQLEASNEAFETVPMAFWWVFARMVNFRSLPYISGTPMTWVGAWLLAFVAGFQKILWILPFSQIGAKFKEVWAESETLQRLRNDNMRELARLPGTGWTEAPNTPAACVEVWTVSGTDEDELVGVGELPVPIREGRPLTAHMTVPLLWSSMQATSKGMAHIEFEVKWHPQPLEVKGEKVPCGQLEVHMLRGQNFHGSPAKGWKVMLSVDIAAFGRRMETTWTSSASTGSAPAPEWQEGHTFHISWDELDTSSNCSMGPEELQDNMLQHLEAQQRQLEEHARRIAHMKKEVLAKM